ncbi:MAG: S8/S53 family peptidase [Flavisolibacter sp.]
MKKPFILFFAIGFCLSLAAQQQENLDGKISLQLKKLIEHPSNDSTDIICAVKDVSILQNAKSQMRFINGYAPSKTIIVRVSNKQLQNFIANKAIEFADVLRKPKEELTTGAFDLTLNKINLAHHAFAKVNGDSIEVSIKEQLLDSTDIDIKGRYFNSGVGNDNQTSHAAIMATIIAGGGNTSPYAVGAATGANVTSSSFVNLLPDADAVYKQFNISVQNHSYGTGIENYYGADTRAYDISVNNNPFLVHVFSAGNSGTTTSTDGAYAGIENAANITGSFKMAKNIITVGSLDSFNNVVPLSSKGPAYDGRIKPELVAYGEDGSSGAAALTSGTVALIQHDYKILHHDSLPPVALVKAALLNSANDVGVKGIDYTSGYGSLNAYNALTTINENHFFQNTISQNEIKTFSIHIPSNTKQIKLTLVWTDTAAAANAAKALVNDLDAVLKLPVTGDAWQPWVLSSYPDKDSLLQPAARKKDTLNTVEQITVDDPQAGNYVLEVTGSHIITASQSFAIAYQIDTANNFQWIYPTGSDVLRAGSVNTLRWQTNMAGDAKIEYSLDGIKWQLLNDNVNAQQQYFQWLVPDTTSKALLRFVIPSVVSEIASDSFVISKPLDLKVGFNCPDSFLLFWNRLPVNQYELYSLGAKYLEPFMQTPDTIKVLQTNNHPSLYYAVAPKIDNKLGWRSYTLNYTTQGVGCYLRTFFAVLQDNKWGFLSAELGSLYNVSSISFQKLTPAGFQTIYTSNNPSLLLNFTDSTLIQGANFYRLQIMLANGQVIYSPTDKVYYLPDNPVLIFPNPAHKNEAIKFVTQEPGKYSVQAFDANGRLVKTFLVQDILQQMTLQLSTGMYFIKIISEDGKTYHQKLIVY